MDAATIERLQVEFGADLRPLKQEIDRGKAAVAGFNTHVTSAANAAGGKLSAGAAMAALSIKSMVSAAIGFSAVGLAKQAVDAAAALDKQARAAGMTTEAYQRLALGAKLNGATDDLAPALAKFADNAQLARSKAGELYETLNLAPRCLTWVV